MLPLVSRSRRAAGQRRAFADRRHRGKSQKSPVVFAAFLQHRCKIAALFPSGNPSHLSSFPPRWYAFFRIARLNNKRGLRDMTSGAWMLPRLMRNRAADGRLRSGALYLLASSSVAALLIGGG